MLGKEASPIGILNVTVIQAEQLRSSDMMSENDVYVKFSVNVPVKEAVQATKLQEEEKEEKKMDSSSMNSMKKESGSFPLYQMTQICSSKNPIWNESFALPVYPTSSSCNPTNNTNQCTLYFEVYDQDYTKDDLLGQAQLPIPISKQESIQTHWLDLHPGRLQVLIHYMPKSFLDHFHFKWNLKANELKTRMTKKVVNSLADYAAYKIKGSF